MEALQPQTLRAWMAEARSFRLLDVREAAEWQLARLPGAELRPLSELPVWLPEVLSGGRQETIVVYCHHGLRSARVCGLLSAHGMQDVHNLSGGIERWSQEIDSSVPLY